MFDDLLEELEKYGFEDFAFADDLSVNGIGEEKLHKAIEICMKWTEKNNMKINNDKSGIILWKNKKSRRQSAEKVKIKNIPIVSKYKYLGIMLDS